MGAQLIMSALPSIVRLMILLVGMLVVFALRGSDVDPVLLWLVNDPVEDAEGALDIASLPLVNENGYAVARIAVMDAAGNHVLDAQGDAQYLTVWGSRETPDQGQSFGYFMPNESGKYATSQPTGYADVAGYAGLSPETYFMIEIGIYDADSNWVIAAVSTSSSYAELVEQGFIMPGNIVTPEQTPWTGGHYSIPEPTSGLLILVGGALLALRRKQCANENDGFSGENAT